MYDFEATLTVMLGKNHGPIHPFGCSFYVRGSACLSRQLKESKSAITSFPHMIWEYKTCVIASSQHIQCHKYDGSSSYISWPWACKLTRFDAWEMHKRSHGSPLDLWYGCSACDKNLTQWDLVMSNKEVKQICKQVKKESTRSKFKGTIQKPLPCLDGGILRFHQWNIGTTAPLRIGRIWMLSSKRW